MALTTVKREFFLPNLNGRFQMGTSITKEPGAELKFETNGHATASFATVMATTKIVKANLLLWAAYVSQVR